MTEPLAGDRPSEADNPLAGVLVWSAQVNSPNQDYVVSAVILFRIRGIAVSPAWRCSCAVSPRQGPLIRRQAATGIVYSPRLYPHPQHRLRQATGDITARLMISAAVPRPLTTSPCSFPARPASAPRRSHRTRGGVMAGQGETLVVKAPICTSSTTPLAVLPTARMPQRGERGSLRSVIPSDGSTCSAIGCSDPVEQQGRGPLRASHRGRCGRPKRGITDRGSITS